MRLILCVLCVLGGYMSSSAQIAMPDPKEMSGIPRPVDDLPPGAVSIRLIRGDLSNNIANHPVELQVNGQGRTANTDEGGRAQFSALPAGAILKAVAVVDGERLESQEFPAPAQGGIRLMLVATDKEKAARAAAEAAAPPVTGAVVLGGESRIIIEPDDEIVRVYYMLDIMNTARAPVNPPSPFMFDTPTGATSTTIMQGSSPQANANGTRVRVQGPFPPGRTSVQVAYVLPATTGSAEFSQVFPATLQHLAVIVRKVGEARLSSPLLVRQQDMPAGGDVYIAAAGEGAVAAGQPIVLSITGLPHHSPTPRYVALTLALGIALAGIWASRRPDDPEARGAERKRLIARREKLFQDLVRLELDHRRGRIDQGRFAARREELVAALEHVYGALDTDDAGPQPFDPSTPRQARGRSEHGRGTTSAESPRATSTGDGAQGRPARHSGVEA
jgi:hypothetical protein